MPIAAKKIKQTFFNVLKLKVIDRVDDAHAACVAIRGHADIGTHFTAGQLAKLDGFIADLAGIKDDVVANAIRNAYVESHRCKAAVIAGVND